MDDTCSKAQNVLSMKPHFEIAEINDAEVLTSISISAFHTDFKIAGRSTKGGPPEAD